MCVRYTVVVQLSCTDDAFFTLRSAPLKVVERDFHWTLIFVLMFASIPVIDPMSAPLTLAIKGLRNQQISSHISWHTQKEQSNGRQIVILNNVCTDSQGKGETFRVIQEFQMTYWICRWSIVHFSLVFPSAAFTSQISWNTQRLVCSLCPQWFQCLKVEP